MLGTCQPEKKLNLETVVDVNKCAKNIHLPVTVHTCATLSWLPYIKSTMIGTSIVHTWSTENFNTEVTREVTNVVLLREKNNNEYCKKKCYNFLASDKNRDNEIKKILFWHFKIIIFLWNFESLLNRKKINVSWLIISLKCVFSRGLAVVIHLFLLDHHI